MIHYYFDSLCDFIHRHYRIIAIAFNIILACTTLGIILNTYMYTVEYENTILYKAFNDQNAHIKIAVPNACIIVFSISLIANLICDISYTITNKIKSSSAIYDLILANIFFLNRVFNTSSADVCICKQSIRIMVCVCFNRNQSKFTICICFSGSHDINYQE